MPPIGPIGRAGDPEGGGADKKAVGRLANKDRERGIDLAAGAGVEDLNLQPYGASGPFHIPQCNSVAGALVGFTSTAIRTAAGTNSRSSSSRFNSNSIAKILIPVTLPPGRARLATRPRLTGSSPVTNTMEIVFVVAVSLSEGKPFRHPRRSPQLVVALIPPPAPTAGLLIVGPAVFDGHVLALDKARVFFSPWRNARRGIA